MAGAHGWIAVAVVASLAGGVPAPRGADAGEGSPDLSGTWSGTSKGKEVGLDPENPGGPSRTAFTVDFLQAGEALSGTFESDGDAPVDLAGNAGNGSFWLASGDPDRPLLIHGHADRKASRLQGGVLAGGPDWTMDGRFQAARADVALAGAGSRDRNPAAAAAAEDPVPSPAGAWSGRMAGTARSLETGVRPAKVKFAVSLTATVEGSVATVTLGFPDEEDIVLSGRAGNGAFWVTNGDPASPALILGTVGGRSPRRVLRARGVFAKDTEIAEVTLTLKESRAALQGTAAAGAPLAGATVTLKDRDGIAVTAVTTEGGAFALDAAGLTPPFLLRVDLPPDGAIFGVATEAGVANLHPLTDLILRTWYGVKDLDPGTAFDGLGPGTPVPGAGEIELLEGLVKRAIQKWLVDAGIDPPAFDLLRSPFTADGTGFDGVLDKAAVAPDGSSLTITDGTTTQTSAFGVSAASGTVTVDTAVSSPAGESASRDGTVLGFDSPTEEAVAGAMATLEAFRAKIHSRGAALTASDLAAFATPDYLGEGLSRTQWSAQYATIFRGATMDPPALRSVVSFDPDDGILVLDVALTFSAAGESGTHRMRWSFRKSGQEWLLHGDRKVGEVRLGAECRTDYRPGGQDGPRRHLSVDVTPPVGTVQSVTISGGGFFNGSVLTKGSQTRLETFRPTPTTEFDMEWDRFWIELDVEVFPVPGTEFQITVKPASGPDIVYTVESGATTTETVGILAPLGNTLAVDAHPGTPLTARWTRPTTFAVDRLEFSGSAYSEDYSLDVRSDSPMTTTATEGVVTLPATAGGQTVTSADLYLAFEGPHGELIVVLWIFE